MSFFGFVNPTFNPSHTDIYLVAIANRGLEDLQRLPVGVYLATTSVLLLHGLPRQAAQDGNLSIYVAPSPTLLL